MHFQKYMFNTWDCTVKKLVDCVKFPPQTSKSLDAKHEVEFILESKVEQIATSLEFRNLLYLHFFKIFLLLLIALRFCYLHIFLNTCQKLFGYFLCNLRWFSKMYKQGMRVNFRMRKLTFWMAYFFIDMIYFKILKTWRGV